MFHYFGQAQKQKHRQKKVQFIIFLNVFTHTHRSHHSPKPTLTLRRTSWRIKKIVQFRQYFLLSSTIFTLFVLSAFCHLHPFASLISIRPHARFYPSTPSYFSTHPPIAGRTRNEIDERTISV